MAYHASLYIACSRELGRKPPLYLAVKYPLTLLPPVVGHAVAIPDGGLTRFAYTLQVAMTTLSLYITCSRELGRKPPLYLAVEDPLTLLPPVVGHAVAIPVGGLTRFAYTLQVALTTLSLYLSVRKHGRSSLIPAGGYASVGTLPYTLRWLATLSLYLSVIDSLRLYLRCYHAIRYTFGGVF